MIDIQITKQLGAFTLNTAFRSESSTVGILGASGCGKSMTLKCIAGTETPDSGHIIINNRTLFDSDKKINIKAQKRRVGYLFQSYALFPTMTVEKNILAAAHGSKSEKKQQAAELIAAFGLSGMEKLLPHQLSGGQQQRTALARLIASEPDIVLLDEAFSALDGFLRERMQLEILEFLDKYKLPAVIVSHDRDEIYKMTQDIAVMDNGSVCAFGKTRDVFENPIDKISARLTGCKNISRIKRLSARKLFAEDWGIELKTAEDITDGINHVGIRAHDISECDAEKENTLAANITDSLESPFEITRIVKTASGGAIWHKLSRDSRSFSAHGSGYIYLPPEKLLLLR